MGDYQQAHNYQKENKKEGDVSIKKNNKKRRNQNDRDDFGDYVNFEEVDDK